MSKYDINNLEKLEEVTELRDVWHNEASDFTPWLYKEGFKLLSEELGIVIEPEEKESSVGNYSLDILAREVNSDKIIVIENQLEDTNHDHLGKIITYASGKDASIIIWVVKHARDEHKSAIEWLNNNTNENIGFFLVEIKLFKIGNSNLAPKFVIVEKPNEWTKIQHKGGVTPTEQKRNDFWTEFNNYAFSNNSNNKEFKKEFKERKPSYDHWLSYSIGKSSELIAIQIFISSNEVGVDYEISDKSKEIFNRYLKNKNEIEKEIGLSFDWQELEGKILSRIRIKKEIDFNSNESRREVMDWIMNTMIKIKKAFNKY